MTSETGEADAEGAPSAARIRDGLVVLLAATTGVADATAYLALGQVFSSVMTGNMVLLGVGAATHGADTALRAGLALAGYAAGVLVGAPAAARQSRGRTWPAAVTATLGLEACLLLAAAITWEVTSRTGGARIALLILLAAGMGIQAAAVRRLGQMSTTYLTSTFTGVIGNLATGRRSGALGRSVGVLLSAIAGAVVAGLLIRFEPGWIPVALLAPLLTVIARAAGGRVNSAADA